jgi:hypothetical protein
MHAVKTTTKFRNQLGEARFPSIGSRLSMIWATVNRLSRFCGREAEGKTVNCPVLTLTPQVRCELDGIIPARQTRHLPRDRGLCVSWRCSRGPDSPADSSSRAKRALSIPVMGNEFSCSPLIRTTDMSDFPNEMENRRLAVIFTRCKAGVLARG